MTVTLNVKIASVFFKDVFYLKTFPVLGSIWIPLSIISCSELLFIKILSKFSVLITLCNGSVLKFEINFSLAKSLFASNCLNK